MFTALRHFFFNKNLRHLLSIQKRARRTHTLETARTVGLLFEASSDKIRQEVSDYARLLEKKGKKVQLLGFFNTPQPPATTPDFPFFFKKETTWTGEPRSQKATAFSTEKLDLLLTLNPGSLSPLTWLAAQSQAAMKIGYATEQPNDLDLQLETPPEKGIRHFTEQLERYLEKIRVEKG